MGIFNLCILADVSHITQTAIHCVNPECKRPYPQPWGNKFCNSCGTVLQLLDRYVPVKLLGAGGFAQIYTVWDHKTQTEKVLKVLVEDSPKALELFKQEADVLIDLRHPGVPRVEHDGYFQLNLPTPKPRQLPCLVMEKIHGDTLEKVLEEIYPQGCPEHLVLNWLSQAVNILEELHKRQIIHRDIKPSNLMLRNVSPSAPQKPGENKVQLVLIDFGGVKQFKNAQMRRESSSTKLYTPGYSAPEQVSGSNVSPGVDFYALGRTMIELLTGKSPGDLEDPQTGVLQWRHRVNVNPQLGDLLDAMVQPDVRSRPASARIIQKRIRKITSKSSPSQFFDRIKKRVQQKTTQVAGQFTLLIQAIEEGFNNLTTAIGQTLVLIAQTILKILQACLATIWAMLITTLGAGIGILLGGFVAYRTELDEQISAYIVEQLPELVSDTSLVLGTEIIIFVSAGLGTAWGLTVSGCFGQRRRFLLASLLGIISYGLSWFFVTFVTQKHSDEGLLVIILVAVFLLTVNLRFRSHHIVHGIVAAFGTANSFAVLILLGFPRTVFEFSQLPLWTALYLPIAFFSLVGMLMSFWLGVSYYLIVPGLKWLGWR